MSEILYVGHLEIKRKIDVEFTSERTTLAGLQVAAIDAAADRGLLDLERDMVFVPWVEKAKEEA